MANWLNSWYSTSSNNVNGGGMVGTIGGISNADLGGVSAGLAAVADGRTRSLAEIRAESALITMPVPKPLTLDEEFNRLELEEHAALCKEVGVWSDSTKKIGAADLRRYLHGKGIQVYDFSSVETYLKSIAPKSRVYLGGGNFSEQSAEIVWRPLRASDLKLHSLGGQQYTKPVPIHILQLVKEMEAEKPGELYFSVSDYQAVRPDPFLAVTTRSFSPWPALVIAHWDEPAYKVKLEK